MYSYPNYWDDLSRKLGFSVSSPVPATKETGDSNVALIIVGMRGAGKTHMSEAIASTLGLGLVDADQVRILIHFEFSFSY